MKTLLVILTAVIVGLMNAFYSPSAHAAQITAQRLPASELRDLSSELQAPTTPKKSKSEQIREYAQTCFDNELLAWELKRGRLPTDEEADFIIDACANPKLK